MASLIIADYVDLAAGIGLCAVLGANNLSACLGSSVGVRALKYRQALVLASIGLLAGVVLEGYKVSGAISSGIVKTNDPEFALAVELSSLVLMYVITCKRIPVSLSQVAVGAAIGSGIARGISINWDFATIVATSWLLTPLVGFTLALMLSFATKLLVKRSRSALHLNLFYAYLTVISGVYAAYALGANTVGFVVGMNEVSGISSILLSIIFAFAAIVGMVVFGRGTTQSVAENIIGLSPSASFAAQMGGAITVHGFTEVGIPVSVSQAVVGGIFGAAVPRKIVVRNSRLTREIIFGWTIAPILGAALGFLAGACWHHDANVAQIVIAIAIARI
jgi:PiT family inorganic phosphate transporter